VAKEDESIGDCCGSQHMSANVTSKTAAAFLDHLSDRLQQHINCAKGDLFVQVGLIAAVRCLGFASSRGILLAVFGVSIVRNDMRVSATESAIVGLMRVDVGLQDSYNIRGQLLCELLHFRCDRFPVSFSSSSFPETYNVNSGQQTHNQHLPQHKG